MNFTQILKYQEVDLKLFRIEMEIQNSKDRKSAIEARDYLKSAEGQLKDMDSKSAEFKKQFDSINSLFNEKQESVNAIKAKANKASTDEEINASIGELTNASKELQRLSSQLFNLSKQMEELSKAYRDLTEKIKKAREKYDTGRDKLNALKASKEEEKQALTKELEELKSGIDAKIFERYTKLREQSVMPVFTTLNGSHCGSCGMTISQTQIEELNSKGYIECESCRRILIK